MKRNIQKRTIQTSNVLLAFTLALTLGGCSEGMKKTLGLEANPPDAFDVGTQAPLALPPELGALPPPNLGEPRPQQVDAAQEGLDTLSPQSSIDTPSGNASAGEQALLGQAGPAPPAGIRASVNQSALVASKPPGFVANLLGTAPTPSPTVDAAAEQRRIQQDEALGIPPTQGDTPEEDTQGPGIFQRFLNLF